MFPHKDRSVSTHSRPKAAGRLVQNEVRRWYRFNTQPPEGGWGWCRRYGQHPFGFQHTAARRRLATITLTTSLYWMFQHTAARRRLAVKTNRAIRHCSFNTQPPEGGWTSSPLITCEVIVSTHSRPKAAGFVGTL